MVRTVVYFTDSAVFGGAEQVLLTTFAGLDRCRWRPVLVHHPETGITPLLEKARHLDVRTWTLPRIQNKRAVLRFARDLRCESPAVFHANLNWPLSCTCALYAAALARIPAVIATQHLYAGGLSRRMRLQQRVVALGVDRYIAVSDDVARQLREIILWAAGKLQVVRNGIPLSTYTQPSKRTDNAVCTASNAPITILTVARLHRQKGLNHLLSAAALLPEARFVIAGDGPERTALETQARLLGVSNRVSFLGYREDIPNLLARCDIFVLPSLFEGHPLSLLEAMAAGKPVIASAIAGIDETIANDQNGLLVPPADPAALAMAIRSIISDRGLAQRLATAASARVRQEFSAEPMVQSIVQIYQDILASRNKFSAHA